MKSVTEFPSFILNKGLQAKTALATEGKTPEEIQASLGATFKYEGDKLKHFINSLDVAGKNSENLKRVVVMSLNEGENAPNRSVKVDEHYYVVESMAHSMTISQPKKEAKGGRGGRGGGQGRGGPGGGKKESPWGLSPEEKAAKKGKGPEAKPTKN